MKEGKKFITKNRHAFHEYTVLDSFEAGIVLEGTEVKSIRMHNTFSLKEAYVDFTENEAWLVGSRISPYDKGNRNNHEPVRRRKLLLKKMEINRLIKRVEEKGLTVIPLSAYFKQGKVKVEIGLCRGKRLYDKRESIKQRETDREIERAVKRYKT
ncbi:MAG TPA: SsrA-binding protein SmpB [Candidatus Hydrogenedentes bacterium]|jgi:SsrA-binding protein|nr:MAG: SsrA-binding protein [Candidatus Hydrogenedentes bacterium ADurb.Bin170]HNZ47247.1 SsrA-binding protein SmpB [Candidatus Hydrogenedentota bacterium]HOD94493.1 SsrA-binding protein SmpB [Candidatus Hydrogenedentota bacterium]HOM47253.1 SsrA-binding protein SmpB [Candidatus Hydrogenedentota bacterium]HOR49869.1 SsrA-binding protein SmpB [Candidatus Hydrogenedentota bacterium]